MASEANPGVIAAFLATWTLMMAAMMLPSTIPLIRLHRLGANGAGRLRTEARTAAFVCGYLVVWGSLGMAVWIGGRIADQLLPPDTRVLAVAAVLLGAGVYQFSPLKGTCLRACRTPMDFLLTHWHRGPAGALRLGLEHGLYCLGCCWALMAVFVVAGGMGLVWAVAVAAAVFIEKVLPFGVRFGRATGVALIAGALAVVIRPELAGAVVH